MIVSKWLMMINTGATIKATFSALIVVSFLKKFFRNNAARINIKYKLKVKN